MNELEEVIKYDSYTEKITAIASKMAVNEYNFSKGKMRNLDSKINDNIILVQKMITQINGTIKKKSGDLTLPNDLNDIIAGYLLQNITSEVIEITQLDSNGMISDKIFKQEILASKDEEEIKDSETTRKADDGIIYDKENNKEKSEEKIGREFDDLLGRLENEGIYGYSYKIPNEEESRRLEDIGKVDRVLINADGNKLYIIDDPEDEAHKKPENEANFVEDEIWIKQQEIEKNLIKLTFDKNKTAEEHIKEIEGYLQGLGIDAAMRTLYNQLEISGAIRYFRNDSKENTVYRELLAKVLEATKPDAAKENGFEEDQYTMMNKMGIYSKLLNDPQMQKDSRYQVEIRKLLKESDPELYARLEKDPDLFRKMQTVSGHNDFLAVTNEVFGRETLSREEFFDKMDEFLEKHEDLELEPEDEEKYKRFEKAYLEEVTEREKKELRKSSRKFSQRVKQSRFRGGKVSLETLKNHDAVFNRKCRRMFVKSGVGVAITSLFNKDRIKTDKDGRIIRVVNSYLNFDKPDKINNFVSQITSDDIDLMKKALNNLLEYQGDEKYKSYIMALGEIVKKSTDKQQELMRNQEEGEKEKVPLLSTNKKIVKEVIRSVSAEGSDMFESKKQKMQDEER